MIILYQTIKSSSINYFSVRDQICKHISGHLLTSLTSDDHRLHDETEEFIQHQMKVKDQRLQTGGGQGDDAEL